MVLFPDGHCVSMQNKEQKERHLDGSITNYNSILKRGCFYSAICSQAIFSIALTCCLNFFEFALVSVRDKIVTSWKTVKIARILLFSQLTGIEENWYSHITPTVQGWLVLLQWSSYSKFYDNHNLKCFYDFYNLGHNILDCCKSFDSSQV